MTSDPFATSQGIARDRRGYPRSPVTLAEYRRGKAPANKDLRLPAEVVSPADVRRLLASFDERATDVRNRAMVLLMYRAELKCVQVFALERRQYDRERGILTIPARTRRQPPPNVEILLDLRTKAAMDLWMVERAKAQIGRSAPMFCVIQGRSKGGRLGSPYFREMLKSKADQLGIEQRLTPEGLKRSGAVHKERSRGRIELQLSHYVDTESLEERFPAAFDRWEAAADQFTAHPTRHADRIGHDCRSAMSKFLDEALELVFLETTVGDGLVTRLRALFETSEQTSKAVAAHLEALLAYWGTLCDLVNRQEHSAKREGEALKAEDSRRLIFYTLLVMLEIERAVLPSAEMSARNHHPR